MNQFQRKFGEGFSWNDQKLKDLARLNRNETIHCSTPFEIRHALNAVTVSYSLQWFSWPKWERLIDWMALNGINAPLMPIGHEAVERRMLSDFNMTDTTWLTGPAFLSWFRMGNLQKWGGPPSDFWIEQQLSLGSQIVRRMVSDFEMTPVMPAFSGFVPDQFKDLYPNAEVMNLTSWSGFNCTNSCITWLEPADKMFKQMQTSYTNHQMELFGYKPKYYALDMFNEVQPKSDNTSFLAQTALDVQTSLPEGSIWVMQGWLFHETPQFWQPAQVKAFLQGVPIGKMLILDLYAENSPIFNQTQSFYGQPFIWCMLGNFGGNTGWYGALPDIRHSLHLAKGSSVLVCLLLLFILEYPNTTLIGTGITPEGLFQNEIVYDFTLKQGYHGSIEKTETFVREWINARYGSGLRHELRQEASDIFDYLTKTVWGREQIEIHPNRDAQKSTGTNYTLRYNHLGIITYNSTGNLV